MAETHEAVLTLTTKILENLAFVRESASVMANTEQQLLDVVGQVDAAEEQFKMLLNVLYR